ncbi:MAG: ABC transporter permease subunit [Lewinellaceae bacterium]|nr:ABC transporter permease subunit [Lewinellaceae bacterium]
MSGTFAGVALAHFLIVFPFVVILSTAHWSAQLEAMEDLVHTLGGSSWQAWRYVLLPLSAKALLTVFFQAFLISWFDYGLTSVIGLGQVSTMTLRVFQYIGEANPVYAAMGSCLLVFPPLLLLWINKNMVLRAK